MRPFRYEKATDAAAAVQFFAQGAQAKYLGGGTNLVDLMRENIERPEMVIDVTGLSREIRARRMAASSSTRVRRTPQLPATVPFGNAIPCWRRRFWQAPRRKFGTWRWSVAT